MQRNLKNRDLGAKWGIFTKMVITRAKKLTDLKRLKTPVTTFNGEIISSIYKMGPKIGAF